MRPVDVNPEWVEAALNTRLPSGGLPTLNGPQMRAILAAVLPKAMAEAFESGARHYAAVDPCCGTYHLHEIENPHTGEPIPTHEGEDDL